MTAGLNCTFPTECLFSQEVDAGREAVSEEGILLPRVGGKVTEVRKSIPPKLSNYARPSSRFAETRAFCLQCARTPRELTRLLEAKKKKNRYFGLVLLGPD